MHGGGGTSTQLNSLFSQLQWLQGQQLFLSSFSSLHSHILSSHFALFAWCLFIDMMVSPFLQQQLHMLYLSMVGATTIDKW